MSDPLSEANAAFFAAAPKGEQPPSWKEVARYRRCLRHAAAVREHWHSVVAIKEAIAEGDIPYAVQCFNELDPAIQIALWVAPTYGGIWTTAERTAIKFGKADE